MDKLQAHRLAGLMPLPTQEEYAALRDDIKANGQRLPIILYEGKILDGRTRYRACLELNIEPKTAEYKGNKPAAFVISLNVNRRHLNASQRACLAVGFKPELAKEAKKRQATSTGGKKPQLQALMPEAEKKGQARDLAATAFDVSPRYVSDAEVLATEHPKMFEESWRQRQPLSANARNKPVQNLVT